MKHNWNCAIVLCACLMAVPVQAETAISLPTHSPLSQAYYMPAGCTRVDACLALLKSEMANPSPVAFNQISGGPTDTGDRQGQIMGAVWTFRDGAIGRESTRNAVRARLRAVPRTDRAMRDRLAIILGYAGDKTVVPTLVQILVNSPDGFIRHAAAHALRWEESTSSIPALRYALATDTYARVRFGESCANPILDQKKMFYSPVREAAAEALRAMGQSVPQDSEVVDARCAIPALESVLAAAKGWEIYTPLQVLGAAACPETDAAIQRYIDSKPDSEKRQLNDSFRQLLAARAQRAKPLSTVKHQ